MVGINGAVKRTFDDLPSNPRNFREAEIIVRKGKVTIRMIEARKGDLAPSLDAIAYNGTRILEDDKDPTFTIQRMPAWENRRQERMEYLNGKRNPRPASGGPLEVDFLRTLEQLVSRPDFFEQFPKRSVARLRNALARDGIKIPTIQPAIESR